ncbi:MAG: GAF domain-containing protein [Chloroflexi bacterium]|nr:GAF domain-containing protein [Chloroflexota bacterium]
MNDKDKTKTQLIRELAALRQQLADRKTAVPPQQTSDIPDNEQYKALYRMVRLMCDNVPDMIWAKDMEKRFIFTNKAICEKLLHAKDTEEPIGKTDLYFARRERQMRPNDPDWHTFGEICVNSDSVVMDQKPQRFDEWGNVRGQFLFLDVYKAPFWNEAGEMIGTVGCGRIVTQEKQLAAEREQLLKDLEKQTRQLAALHETALEITTRREMPDLLQAIAFRAANLLDVPGSTIQLVEPGSETLIVAVVYGLGKALQDQQIHRGQGVTGRVWATGQPLIINNYDAWAGQIDSLPPGLIGSVIAVPIKLAGDVIGVLTCHTEGGIYDAFTDEDAQLLENLARQAAIAMENARLFAIERKRSAELETLHQASLHLTSSLEYQPILEAIVGHVLQLVDAEDAHIFLYDGRTLHFGAVAWADEPEQEPYIQPRSGGLTYSVARSGQRIVVPSVNTHPLFENHPWDWDGGIIGLPLCSGDQVYGVMNVAFSQPHAFDENDLRILDLLADQAAIALQNARLYTAERQHRQQAETLRAAATALAQTLHLDTVLQTLLDYLRQLVPYDSASVMLRESETQVAAYVTHGHEKWSDPELARRITFDITNRSVQILLNEKRSYLIADTRKFRGWERPSGAEHVISWLGVPLIAGGQAVGFFSLDKTEPDFFTEQHRRLAESLAGPAAIAITNARLYTQAQQDANTKATLLREVNHRVKNNLTGIIGLLYATRDRTRVENQAEFQAVINELIGRVWGLTAAHEMFSASGWQPIHLSDLTRQVIQSVSRTLPNGKKLSVEIEPSDIRVTANEAHNLALVINELTTNTVKHVLSQRSAAHIACRSECSEGVVHCLFRDDGPGFAADVLSGKRYNMGFELIRSIVQDNLGGTLSLYNNEGAAVQITFPASLPEEEGL